MSHSLRHCCLDGGGPHPSRSPPSSPHPSTCTISPRGHPGGPLSVSSTTLSAGRVPLQVHLYLNGRKSCLPEVGPTRTGGGVPWDLSHTDLCRHHQCGPHTRPVPHPPPVLTSEPRDVTGPAGVGPLAARGVTSPQDSPSVSATAPGGASTWWAASRRRSRGTPSRRGSACSSSRRGCTCVCTPRCRAGGAGRRSGTSALGPAPHSAPAPHPTRPATDWGRGPGSSSLGGFELRK